MHMIRIARSGVILGLSLVLVSPARAQFGFGGDSSLKTTTAERRHRWKVGTVVMARSGPCAGIFVTIPLPVDWPEQDVKIVKEQISDNVGRVRYRTLPGKIRQMVLTIPRLEAGAQAQALLTFSITRRSLPLPDTATLRRPEKMPRDVRIYLTSSPFIETRQARIRSEASALQKEDASGWAQVKAIYDWVKTHVTQRNEPRKGALRAIRDGHGNHEDIAGLFIALCRANKIPARTVWVPEYCYAEFYLEDDEAAGHWIPCEFKEKSELGTIADLLPILEKGDSFRVPEKKEPQRFVAEFMKGSTGRGLGRPGVRFVRQLLPPE